MPLTCIIVDDMEQDKEILESYINDTRELVLEAYCSSVTEGKNYLAKGLQPDLIFCDIMLGDTDGLSFIKNLENPPMVIFTTSFPNFAVTGFELDAVDYLIKPYTYKRFSQAIKKALERKAMLSESNIQRETEDIKTASDHFFIRSEHNIIRIDYDDVIYIEGLRDYVKIITANQTFLTAMHLKLIEDKLPSSHFVRIHRSFILNKSKITSLNNYEVIAAGKSLPLGENYKELFFKEVINKNLIRK